MVLFLLRHLRVLRSEDIIRNPRGLDGWMVRLSKQTPPNEKENAKNIRIASSARCQNIKYFTARRTKA